MKFYRANEYRDFSDGTVLVKNELLTEKEKVSSGYPEAWFTPVEVKKSETYWFFGARFACEEEVSNAR